MVDTLSNSLSLFFIWLSNGIFNLYSLIPPSGIYWIVGAFIAMALINILLVELFMSRLMNRVYSFGGENHQAITYWEKIDKGRTAHLKKGLYFIKPSLLGLLLVLPLYFSIGGFYEALSLDHSEANRYSYYYESIMQTIKQSGMTINEAKYFYIDYTMLLCLSIFIFAFIAITSNSLKRHYMKLEVNLHDYLKSS